jgi:hypothetical protein
MTTTVCRLTSHALRRVTRRRHLSTTPTPPVAHALEAGVVWVNCWGTIPNAAPFGGYKKSGFGREGGKSALEEFTQVKNVYIDLS